MTDDTPLPTLLASSAKSSFRLRVHAAAWSDDCGGTVGRYGMERPGLVLLSATGPDTSVKAIRAVLYQPEIEAEFNLEFDDSSEYGVSGERLAKARYEDKPVGYTAAVAKLAPGAVHLVALARIPGLMPCLSDDHLWAELCGPKHTTPLLRGWVGWLKRAMIEGGQIVMAEGYGATNTGILAVQPDELDAMVSSGVRQGYLRMVA